MRWVGPAEAVTTVARVNVRYRNDDGGRRKYLTIPDHVETVCQMASGPVAHLRFSTVTGLAPADGVWLFGTEGTLHLNSSDMTLRGGRRGDTQLSEIEVPAENQGAWRVEEEFINAIRGLEPITHTSFEDGVRYMEFTDAVTISAQSGQTVYLPL